MLTIWQNITLIFAKNLALSLVYAGKRVIFAALNLKYLIMDNTSHRVKTLRQVAVRFSGDSGDGMQLAGNIFTNVSAGLGNSVSTFPDYPAEIRAPQGSLGGVSGFQVSIGAGVHTPGDQCDVLVAMNPAALKQNYKFLRRGGVIITDIDAFKPEGLKKALYKTDDAIADKGIGEQNDWSHVLYGDAGGLEGRVETVSGAQRRHHHQRRLAVAAIERLHEIGLFGLGGEARRWAAALNVDHNQGQFGHHGQTQGLALQRQTGA